MDSMSKCEYDDNGLFYYKYDETYYIGFNVNWDIIWYIKKDGKFIKKLR